METPCRRSVWSLSCGLSSPCKCCRLCLPQEGSSLFRRVLGRLSSTNGELPAKVFCLVTELQATFGPRRRRRRRRRPHMILSIRLSQILPCSSHVDYCLHPSKQHPPLFSRCSKVLGTAEGSRHGFLFLSRLEKSSVRDAASRAQEIIQFACLLAFIFGTTSCTLPLK